MTIETKFNPGDTMVALVTPYGGKTALRKIKIADIYVDERGVVYRDEDYNQHREENLFMTAKGAAYALLNEFEAHESAIDFDNTENPEES